MQLSVSCHVHSGMLAVGWRENGALLPADVRVVELEMGELVAQGVQAEIESARAWGHPPSIDLDKIVANAERIISQYRHGSTDVPARRRARGSGAGDSRAFAWLRPLWRRRIRPGRLGLGFRRR